MNDFSSAASGVISCGTVFLILQTSLETRFIFFFNYIALKEKKSSESFCR